MQMYSYQCNLYGICYIKSTYPDVSCLDSANSTFPLNIKPSKRDASEKPALVIEEKNIGIKTVKVYFSVQKVWFSWPNKNKKDNSKLTTVSKNHKYC